MTDGVISIQVRFSLANTGSRAGAEVPQVYLGLPASTGEPPKRLVAFDKVWLEPGEEKQVTLTIDPAASNHPLSYWDTSKQGWAIADGEYTVYVGSSSRDIAQIGSFTVAQSSCSADVSSKFGILRSGFHFSNATKRFQETVTITNENEQTIDGPFAFVLDGLTLNADAWSSVALINTGGRTSCALPAGNPYVVIAPPAGQSWSPGQSVTIQLEFVDPPNAAIKYSPRVLAGGVRR